MKKIIVLFLLSPLLAYGNNIRCLLPGGIQFEMLIPIGQMKSSYHFTEGPHGEVYLVADGMCINLFNEKSDIIAFPGSFGLKDVAWTKNEDCFFSDESSIYFKNKKNDSIVLQLVNTTMKNIKFRLSDYGIYYYENQTPELFFFSFPHAVSTKVCQFPDPINDVIVSDDACFVSYGENIGLINRNREFTRLFSISDTITSLEIGSDGTLFYGTTDGLFCRNNEGKQLQISDNGVSTLLVEKDNLYICFSNGSSAKLQGISNYLGKNETSIVKDKKSDVLSILGQHRINALFDSRKCLANFQIQKAATLYSDAINHEQLQRDDGIGVNGELLAEYAYSLALHHDFEAALMNIDRARMVGTKYGDFYAAQVLAVMGYQDAAQQLMRQAKVPEWINGSYQGLTEKYKTAASINRDAPETALKRANKLAANRQTIQAMALFEELAAIYPDTYIIYVDYSTVWESLGYYAYAAQLLQKGIDLMPREQSENKQIFQNHLTKVDELKAKFENASWMKRLLGVNSPKLMTYVGASAAKKMFSLNGRMGFYTSNRFSSSLNVGLNYSGKQFSGSIGLSGYKAWGIFVGGLGLTDTFGKGQNSFSLTPSVGLSFLNHSQTSSFDIMLNGYIPFSKGQKFTYSISIGKTIYFDFNGKRK